MGWVDAGGGRPEEGVVVDLVADFAGEGKEGEWMGGYGSGVW